MEASQLIMLLSNPVPLTEQMLQPTGLANDEIKGIINIQQSLLQLQQMQSDELKHQAALTQGSTNETFNVITELKKSLKNTLSESQSAQFISKFMFISIFCLGFVLIGFSIYFAMRGQQTMAIVFGSFGFADIVAHLLADPPLKIQDARSNYAQLTVGILAWFNDLLDKSSMAVINNQILSGIAASEEKLTDKLKAHQENIKNYLTISDAQINNTVKILTLIDEVAEPSNKIKISKSKPAAEV